MGDNPMNKKSDRVKFTFDERSLTTLENMADATEAIDTVAILVRNPQTGETKSVFIPKLPRLPLVR